MAAPLLLHHTARGSMLAEKLLKNILKINHWLELVAAYIGWVFPKNISVIWKICNDSFTANRLYLIVMYIKERICSLYN